MNPPYIFNGGGVCPKTGESTSTKRQQESRFGKQSGEAPIQIGHRRAHKKQDSHEQNFF